MIFERNWIAEKLEWGGEYQNFLLNKKFFIHFFFLFF